MAFARNGKLPSRVNARIRPGVKIAAMLKVSISPNWLPAYARISMTGIIPHSVASINTGTRIEVRPIGRFSTQNGITGIILRPKR